MKNYQFHSYNQKISTNEKVIKFSLVDVNHKDIISSGGLYFLSSTHNFNCSLLSIQHRYFKFNQVSFNYSLSNFSHFSSSHFLPFSLTSTIYPLRPIVNRAFLMASRCKTGPQANTKPSTTIKKPTTTSTTTVTVKKPPQTNPQQKLQQQKQLQEQQRKQHELEAQQHAALARYREDRLLESYLLMENEYNEIQNHTIDYSIQIEREDLRSVDYTKEYQLDIVGEDDLVSVKNAVKREERMRKKMESMGQKNNNNENISISSSSSQHPTIASNTLDPLFDDSCDDDDNTNDDKDPYEGLSQMEILQMMMSGVGLHDDNDKKDKKITKKVPLKKESHVPISLKFSSGNGNGGDVKSKGDLDHKVSNNNTLSTIHKNNNTITTPSNNSTIPSQSRILKLDLNDILGKEDMEKVMNIDRNLARSDEKKSFQIQKEDAKKEKSQEEKNSSSSSNQEQFETIGNNTTTLDDFAVEFPTVP